MRVKSGQGEESRETKPPGIRVDDRATESDSNCLQANQDQFFSRAARQAGNKDVKSDEEEIARGGGGYGGSGERELRVATVNLEVFRAILVRVFVVSILPSHFILDSSSFLVPG